MNASDEAKLIKAMLPIADAMGKIIGMRDMVDNKDAFLVLGENIAESLWKFVNQIEAQRGCEVVYTYFGSILSRAAARKGEDPPRKPRPHPGQGLLS